jgi:hypothetical protein
MKTLYLIEYLIIFTTTTVSAQVDTSVMKPDSTPATQNKPVELPSSQPLANKTFGIEFNPIRLLIGRGDNIFNTQIHGGVSLFSIDRHAEIAFPFLYMFGKFDEVPSKILNIDATYRRFFTKQQKGFYYSAGLQYNYLQGPEDSDDPSNPLAHTDKQISQSRVGIYIGLGYRYFSKKGFYWGTSIICGPYFSKMDPRFNLGPDLGPLELILAWDLLKFGYAF